MSLELGAHQYIDSESQDVAKELQKLGGAKVVLATVTSTKAMSPTVDGLCLGGKLLVVGAGTEPFDVTPLQLLVRAVDQRLGQAVLLKIQKSACNSVH